MKYLDKLLEIANNIKKIYDDLSEIEACDPVDENKYQEKLEHLKLYKEIEDEYYKKVRLLSLEEIKRMLKVINVDDAIDKEKSDLGYAFDSVYDNTGIVNRRVYMRIFDISITKESDLTILNAIWLNNNSIDYQRESLDIEDKEILIYNRTKEFLYITNKATYNLHLKYIYFIDLYIKAGYFPNFFIEDKYNLIYISPYIENKMIEYNFRPELFFKDKLVENEYRDETVYKYYIERYSADLLSDVIEDIKEIRNCECVEKNKKTAIQIIYYEAVMRASLLETDEVIIENMLWEAQNIPNGQTTKIRKKIINIMKNAKKDKEQLNYQ